jgi:hypothetical protein
MNTFLIHIKIIKQQFLSFILNVLKGAFNNFGAVIGLIVSLKAVLPETNKMSVTITKGLQDVTFKYLLILYAVLVAYNICRFWPRIKASYNDKLTDSKVIIECCNLFKQKGQKIIHSTDTFDTKLDIMGTETINGQFLKMNEKEIKNIADQIQKGLQNIPSLNKEADETLQGNKFRYEYGTACPINLGDNKYCLVAFGHLCENPRNVEFDPNNYRDFLLRMWTSLSEARFGGKQREIDVAIIGDGLIKFPGAYTRSQKAALMAETFFEVSRRQRICSRLKICIKPDDDALKIDFKNFEEILKFVSERP